MSDRTGARRAAAARRRQRLGLVAVTAYLDADTGDVLIERGVMTSEEWADPQKRAEILGRHISIMLEL